MDTLFSDNNARIDDEFDDDDHYNPILFPFSLLIIFVISAGFI